MLRYTFGETRLADALDRAVAGALDRGLRTRDIAGAGARNVDVVGTEAMTDAVIEGFLEALERPD